MKFRCQFDYYPQPFGPEQYLREMLVEVVGLTHAGEDALFARLAIDHLDLGRAELSSERVYEICDADSAGWEQVYSALFEPGTEAEWRADFDFHEVVTHLAFMHRAVFHPCVREWQSFILDHVANLFGKDSAFLMWKGQTDLTDRQLSQLGYRIIAGEGLLMRPNMLPIDYEAECEGLNALDIDVPEDSVGYVEEAWKEQ
ncbi:MAG: hypothetical protein H6822_31095 [Planctomycetaceae bacterium]|nr:hypothetical protein [Planctomycetales bacterium]MCB9926627.1 hypothetical protein [Planctomycetaceae bacterium]